jgi:hypothetical protein
MGLFKSVLDSQPQLLHVEGFRYVIESAGSFGGKSSAGRVQRGQHDHLTISMDRPHLLKHSQTVRTWHYNVQQNYVRLLIRNPLNRLVCGRGFQNTIRFVEDKLQRLSHPGLIIDNQ